MRSRYTIFFIAMLILAGCGNSLCQSTGFDSISHEINQKESATILPNHLSLNSDPSAIQTHQSTYLVTQLRITVNTTSEWTIIIFQGFSYYFVENKTITYTEDSNVRFGIIIYDNGFGIDFTSGNSLLPYSEAVLYVHLVGITTGTQVNATIQKGNNGISGVLVENVNSAPDTLVSFTQTMNANPMNDLTFELPYVALTNDATTFTPNLEPKAPESVLAFYYTWWVNKEVSGIWSHWDAGGREPESITGNHRDIGATNYPMLGAYDSNDPATIQHHIRMAQAAGIDAFVSSWWGINDETNKNFNLLLKVAEEFDFKATIYLETGPLWDQEDTFAEEALLDQLTYIYENYASRDTFYTIDGTPAIFIYVAGAWNVTFWENIRNLMDSRGQYFNYQGDVLDSTYLKVFDGLHSYMPLNLGDLEGPYKQFTFQNQLAEVIYGSEKKFAATVIPAVDASGIYSTTHPYFGRENGGTYAMTWESSYLSGAELVVITSFNEWHEGSELEYSEEYDDDYLSYTKAYRQLMDPEIEIIGDLDALTGIIFAEKLIVNFKLDNDNNNANIDITEFRRDLDAIIDLYDSEDYHSVIVDLEPLIMRMLSIQGTPTSNTSQTISTSSVSFYWSISIWVILPILSVLLRRTRINY